MHKDDQQGFLN